MKIPWTYLVWKVGEVGDFVAIESIEFSVTIPVEFRASYPKPGAVHGLKLKIFVKESEYEHFVNKSPYKTDCSLLVDIVADITEKNYEFTKTYRMPVLISGVKCPYSEADLACLFGYIPANML